VCKHKNLQEKNGPIARHAIQTCKIEKGFINLALMGKKPIFLINVFMSAHLMCAFG
jgi:hypothetical protein